MADAIELTYDLFSLPTAQHRAGLAGLVVAIDTMRKRDLIDVPNLTYDAHTARVTLTKPGLAALLNDLYEATTEESRQRSTRKNRNGEQIKPLRTETEAFLDRRTGNQRERTVYVYPQVVPAAPPLRALQMPDPWLKLWREAIWSTLRGIPKTRLPYEQRADGVPVAEIEHQWDDLQRWARAGARDSLYAAEVSSSVYIGSQAFNAERVPFRGCPDHSLLLHFWPLVMGVGEARALTIDQNSVKEATSGYVLTVPEVMDLEGFVGEFRAGTAQLSTEIVGFRPRDAILSLPEEGGLQYLNNLAAIARAKATAGAVRFSLAGVEVFHLEKRGNNIAILGSGRVPAREDVVQQYDAIRREYRNLLFRGQLIRNLLRDQPWYVGFDNVFAKHEQDHFFGESGRSFTQDVNRKFQIESSASQGRRVND